MTAVEGDAPTSLGRYFYSHYYPRTTDLCDLVRSELTPTGQQELEERRKGLESQAPAARIGLISPRNKQDHESAIKRERIMAARDHHTALKSETVSKINAGYIEIALAKLQWGKDDIAYTLHVNPSSYTTAGLQTTDWLAYLGLG